MSKGYKCPSCGKSTCEDRNSHHYCNNCGAIFWDLNNSVFLSGKGKGNACHHCNKSTLHNISIIDSNPPVNVFRCSTCHAVLITKG